MLQLLQGVARAEVERNRACLQLLVARLESERLTSTEQLGAGGTTTTNNTTPNKLGLKRTSDPSLSGMLDDPLLLSQPHERVPGALSQTRRRILDDGDDDLFMTGMPLSASGTTTASSNSSSATSSRPGTPTLSPVSSLKFDELEPPRVSPSPQNPTPRLAGASFTADGRLVYFRNFLLSGSRLPVQSTPNASASAKGSSGATGKPDPSSNIPASLRARYNSRGASTGRADSSMPLVGSFVERARSRPTRQRTEPWLDYDADTYPAMEDEEASAADFSSYVFYNEDTDLIDQVLPTPSSASMFYKYVNTQLGRVAALTHSRIRD